VPDGYLPTLDGWRAIAISLVLLDHTVNSTACAEGSLRWCGRIMVGQTGVNLFFGISGFLICSRLLQEFQRTQRISLAGFYIRRAFRILPAALLYLAVMTTLALARQILVSKTELAGSLFFFRNYLGFQSGFYTAHFWSLSLEEQFYVLWPTLLIGLLALPRRWGAACAVGLALAVAGWRHASMGRALMIYGHLPPGFVFRTGVRADGLLLGAALALALRSGVVRLEWIPGWMWGSLLALYIAVVSHFGMQPTIWESALVPVLIAWTAYHPAAVPSRILEWPVLSWVGRISYGLYIWQQFFFPWAHIAAPLPAVQKWPLAVPAALACAAASYYLLERPALRLGHRLARPVVEGRPDLASKQPRAMPAAA
jgi:peptidoglycan/LPS O-acetylase OafA/YrhL